MAQLWHTAAHLQTLPSLRHSDFRLSLKHQGVQTRRLLGQARDLGNVVPVRGWAQARQELVEKCHLMSVLVNGCRHVVRRYICGVFSRLLRNWMVVGSKEHLSEQRRRRFESQQIAANQSKTLGPLSAKT